MDRNGLLLIQLWRTNVGAESIALHGLERSPAGYGRQEKRDYGRVFFGEIKLTMVSL